MPRCCTRTQAGDALEDNGAAVAGSLGNRSCMSLAGIHCILQRAAVAPLAAESCSSAAAVDGFEMVPCCSCNRSCRFPLRGYNPLGFLTLRGLGEWETAAAAAAARPTRKIVPKRMSPRRSGRCCRGLLDLACPPIRLGQNKALTIAC